MNYSRVTNLKAPDGHPIPACMFLPDGAPHGGVAVVPGYGSSKESVLALAAVLAENGLAGLSVDLCGHGENQHPIGPIMREELEAAIGSLRRFGPVGATGISLGGRLALMSSADCMVAISPAVPAQMSPQGKWMFENFPSPTVREPYSGYVLKLLEELGPVRPHNRPCLLLYAIRDIPSLLDAAEALKAELPGAELRYATEELRPDIQHESGLIRYLPRWFNHMELKFNAEVLHTVPAWFAEHLTAAP
jgi:dienelactone hydrolase